MSTERHGRKEKILDPGKWRYHQFMCSYLVPRRVNVLKVQYTLTDGPETPTVLHLRRAGGRIPWTVDAGDLINGSTPKHNIDVLPDPRCLGGGGRSITENMALWFQSDSEFLSSPKSVIVTSTCSLISNQRQWFSTKLIKPEAKCPRLPPGGGLQGWMLTLDSWTKAHNQLRPTVFALWAQAVVVGADKIASSLNNAS